ncbi:MAG: hypothetical protein VKL59_27040 [Nostocaceae cyanobacterium]|nr:hypothetical protein [Nostocaceae cyanobacterium]
MHLCMGAAVGVSAAFTADSPNYLIQMKLYQTFTQKLFKELGLMFVHLESGEQ